MERRTSIDERIRKAFRHRADRRFLIVLNLWGDRAHARDRSPFDSDCGTEDDHLDDHPGGNMKRLPIIFIAPVALAMAIVATPARAQFAESTISSPSQPLPVASPGLHYDGPHAVVGGPVGIASVVMPGKAGGGVIDISPAFAEWLQPYVQSITNALIAAAIGYALTWMRTHWKVNLDDKQRAVITASLQNQASSLIADGKVKISGGKVDIGSDALAAAAADLMRRVPEATSHFGLTPEFVASRIVDAVPQIAAGAAMLAQHHASAEAQGSPKASNLP